MSFDSRYKDLDDDIIEVLRKFEKMVENGKYSYVDYDDCEVILNSFIYIEDEDMAQKALDYFVTLYPEKQALKDYYPVLAFFSGDYDKVISLVPDMEEVDSPMVLSILAESYAHNLCPDKAKIAFEYYLLKENNQKDLSSSIEKIGAVFNENFFPDHALHFLNIGLKFFPDNEDIKTEYARSYYVKGNMQKAKKILSEIFQDNKYPYYSVKLYISICFVLEQFAEALKYIDICLDMKPLDFDLIVKKSRALFNTSHQAEAISLLEKFNEDHPNIELIQSNLAELYLCSGKDVKAFVLFESLYAEHPYNLRYISSLGILFFNSSNYKKAIPFLIQTFEDNPSDAVAFCLAVSFYSENDIENSYKYLKIATEYDSNLYNDFYTLFPEAKQIINKKEL